MLPTKLQIALPDWVQCLDKNDAITYPDDADKVMLAIELSRRNVEDKSGGPFGAAIFGPDHTLLAIGVNCVVPQKNSLAHAEIMAIMFAQHRLNSARLNSVLHPITLATSSQPCCQCFGAILWAGINRLLIGARASDVIMLTGFDEGPLPDHWEEELKQRGIETYRDLHREAACAVLQTYHERSGPLY